MGREFVTLVETIPLKERPKHFWRWTSVVLLISLTGLGLFMFFKSQKTQVCDTLHGTCRGINDPPGDSLAILIYSSEKGINIFNSSTNTSASLITTDQEVSAVFMDAKYIYWSENEEIYRSLKNGTEKEIIAFINIKKVRNIAVDWITRNIYFTDLFYRGIGVCENSGSHCTAILTSYRSPGKRLSRIDGLALHPTTGMMYWTDRRGRSIFKAEMNGKSQASMVTNIDEPSSLTIDYPTSRLYWVDSNKGIVESINLEGTDRRMVVTGVMLYAHYPSIAVFGGRLFWNDIDTNSIYYCDKIAGQGRKTLFQGSSVINGMHIHHSTLKPYFRNPCKDNPCEQICVLAADRSYTCACSLDKTLKDDGKTCKQIKHGYGQHLIVAAGGALYDYHHEVLGKPRWREIDNSRHFADIYSSIHKNLSINDAQILFEEFSRFFEVDGTLGGIAFDHVGGNLYSTNAQERRIEIMSLTTLEKTFIQLTDQPRSIFLIPDLSIMIVTTCINYGCSVNKMSMTGSGREPLRYSSGKGVLLAFDLMSKRLFVTDESGIIESISLEREDDREEVYSSIEAASLAVLGDNVFWTEKNSKKIFWTSKYSRREFPVRGEIGSAGFDVTIPTDVDVMHFIQTSPNYYWSTGLHQKSWKYHECRVNNGGCSHVCLVVSEDSHECRCPANMTLNDDQKTCNIIQEARYKELYQRNVGKRENEYVIIIVLLQFIMYIFY